VKRVHWKIGSGELDLGFVRRDPDSRADGAPEIFRQPPRAKEAVAPVVSAEPETPTDHAPGTLRRLLLVPLVALLIWLRWTERSGWWLIVPVVVLAIVLYPRLRGRR
jgi:hypothetical protein